MNKSELVVAIADRSGVTQHHARGCLDAFLEIVCEEVSAGREVNVTGYMKFSQVKGLIPVKPAVYLKGSVTLGPGQALILSKPA